MLQVHLLLHDFHDLLSVKPTLRFKDVCKRDLKLTEIDPGSLEGLVDFLRLPEVMPFKNELQRARKKAKQITQKTTQEDLRSIFQLRLPHLEKSQP